MKSQQDNIETPFNREFCTQLEFRISSELENSNDEDLKGFWCDGILWKPLIESQLSKKHVNDKRQIITKAWLGKTGQSEYIATIHFGKYSLRRYAKGNDLMESIPTDKSTEWIEIDIENKTLDIKLR